MLLVIVVVCVVAVGWGCCRGCCAWHVPLQLLLLMLLLLVVFVVRVCVMMLFAVDVAECRRRCWLLALLPAAAVAGLCC